MDRFRRENLALIASMARDKVDRVARILDDAPNARVETIRDRILEEQGVTKRQAALIARDQVLSLNAQVTKARHEAAGITQYIWRTSGDGDVRKDHRALNGQTFSYDDPPVVNATEVRRGRAERREHPGQDYQCRCTAEPVIPGFDDVPAKADRRDAGDFKEGEHPRAKDGEFIKKGTGGGGPLSARPIGGSGPRLGKPTSPTSGGGSETTPAKTPRLAFEHPPPPPHRSLIRLRQRSSEPLPNEVPANFSAMPVRAAIHGISLTDHMTTSVQYPANRLNDQAFHDHLVAETRRLSSKTAPEHIEALKYYTGGSFALVNEYLRNGDESFVNKYGAEAVTRVRTMSDGVASALSALPRAPSDMIPFRGIVLPDSTYLDAFARANEFESPSFLSTTRDPRIGVGYAEGEAANALSVLFRVTRHESGVILSPEISVAGETEILFRPGGRFRVIGRQRVSKTRLLLDIEER